MKILMIDDEKCPTSFRKNKDTPFTLEEVTLARNYSDGLTQLLENGPWDVLLLDWNLNEFSRARNGLHILKNLQRKSQTKLVSRVIIITTDEAIRSEMREICKAMVSQGKLDCFEAQ